MLFIEEIYLENNSDLFFTEVAVSKGLTVLMIWWSMLKDKMGPRTEGTIVIFYMNDMVTVAKPCVEKKSCHRQRCFLIALVDCEALTG